MLVELGKGIPQREPEEDMARRKRIPYKPDAFQSYGRTLASSVFVRGRLIIAGLVLAVVAFVMAAVLTSMSATAEQGAWTALGRAGGDTEKLQAVLAEYGSCEARPFMLYAAARVDIAPLVEDGRPKREDAADRSARLSRVESAIDELTNDYPDHYLFFYALCLRGQLTEERGNFQDAAVIFESALASAPNSMAPKVKYDIGRNYYLAGMPKAARSPLEMAAAATRTVTVQRRGADFRLRNVRVEADWIGNARYLLARLGPGERAISLEIPKKVPEKAPEDAPEKSDEDSDEDSAGDSEDAPADAGDAVPPTPAP
jgi:tetratricopeptide (TPR) repeat protein